MEMVDNVESLKVITSDERNFHYVNVLGKKQHWIMLIDKNFK